MVYLTKSDPVTPYAEGWVQDINQITTEVSFSQGHDVAIDGNFAVVGAPLAGSSFGGEAYIYQRTGTIWTILDTLSLSSPATGDFYGGAVDIDGDNIIVSAYQWDGVETNQGIVEFYHWDGQEWEDAGAQISNGQQDWKFGKDVAIHGDYALVGISDADFGPHVDAGRVILYKYDGANWGYIDEINGSAGDHFGELVALSDDFSLMTGAGRVKFYEYDENGFVYKTQNRVYRCHIHRYIK